MGIEHLSKDARRLLGVLELYGSTPVGARAWTKDFTLRAVVFQGICREVFTDYDLGLSMVHYHGNDYFAMCSEEAEGDLKELFLQGLIEKVILNTPFYTPEAAWRLSRQAFCELQAPDSPAADDKAAVRDLVMCRYCGQRCCDYVGIASADIPAMEKYRGRRLYRVCSCYRPKNHYRDVPIRLMPQDECLPNFFSIGDCEYYGRPFFVENINEW